MRDWDDIEEDRKILRFRILNDHELGAATRMHELWRHFLLCEDQIQELKEELKKLKEEP